MNQEYVTAVIRHAITAIGGFMVAQGKTDNATIEAIGGGAVALVGLVWSLMHKKALVTAGKL